MIKKELINKSIDYIIQHFDEGISAKEVAEHFHFSEFYFCRVFKEETGESIYAFIKRLKMDLSAVDIKLEKHKTITDIGLDYGYSPSNYSSAFRKHHNVSPVEFRKSTNCTGMFNPFYHNIPVGFDTFDDYDKKTKIQELKGYLVIYERYIGNYIELKEKWIRFMNTYRDYIKADTLMIERFYDDPSITDLNRCKCDLCITINEISGLDNITMIRAGKFAVHHYEGKINDIFCNLQGLFSVWFPYSGYQMDERYGLNIYREIDIDSEQVIMDICIPIK
ncbi:MAG: AraC family transcriptional regulator [Bacillota bacterium]|nr:AraC family transcriptional regulator [Bacillota bacterium]